MIEDKTTADLKCFFLNNITFVDVKHAMKSSYFLLLISAKDIKTEPDLGWKHDCQETSVRDSFKCRLYSITGTCVFIYWLLLTCNQFGLFV